ncbi:engulfment and cell motility protein 2-like [Anneissia japonica]|uniref:engulfment and cell motility protein 2-like n=1 Tax=Anneissia japonica TaxID=1529436 RepID=UPI0014257213|nr:engulfment and cell motility protein 2-like [Anneissia japonica]
MAMIMTGTDYRGRVLDDNTVRLAVTMKGQNAQLVVFEQDKPLRSIITMLCQDWSLSNHQDYSLQYQDAFIYVTEKNRHELKKGTILKLTDSPQKAASAIFNQLRLSDQEERHQALKKLTLAASDFAFATEFIAKKGSGLLLGLVEGGEERGESLGCALSSFLELMDHGIVSWDLITAVFVKRVAGCVKESPAPKEGTLNPKASIDPVAIKKAEDAAIAKKIFDDVITHKALGLLEAIVNNCTDLYSTVADEITFRDIIPHLNTGNPEIKTSCIALINALCLRAPEDRKKKCDESLASKEVRVAILEVVQKNPTGSDMLHQLYVFQQLNFNLLERKMVTKLSANSEHFPKYKEYLMDLRRIAFSSESESKRANYTADYRKLGFEDCANPSQDFNEAPHVLENSSRGQEHECPFGRTGIVLTKICCEILNVGETPDETSQDFFPLFFALDNAFSEFFCTCIQRLNKTWKEMRATLQDFDKVMDVVKEQIVRALNDKQSSMIKFKSRLAQLGYNEILRLRNVERSKKEEWDSQAPPVVALREKVKPEILDVIRRQRLNFLKEGLQFPKMSRGRSTGKFWYCRLSPNNKVLQYGDTDDGVIPNTEDVLFNKILVADIQTMNVGKECYFAKDLRTNRRGASVITCCSIIYDPDNSLDFFFINQSSFDMWTDGINALLGREMTSAQTQTDLETLLSMEMKLRLLDTTNITIPTEQPPIPPPPSNLNFHFVFE